MTERKESRAPTPRVREFGEVMEMRRKFGILMLLSVTALAGAQEAAGTFANVKASVNDWTRASLWSGLIVYVQPVAGGHQFSSPQLCDALAAQAVSTCPPPTAATLAGGNALHSVVAKAGTKNGHAPAASFTSRDTTAQMLETAQPVTPEFAAEPQGLRFIVANFSSWPGSAPRVSQRRAFAEIASNAPSLWRLAREAGMNSDAFMNEFDAARLVPDAVQLAGERARLESLPGVARGEMEKSRRRFEMRIVRRAEHPERMQPASRIAGLRREVSWPEVSPSLPDSAPEAEARRGGEGEAERSSIEAGAVSKSADGVQASRRYVTAAESEQR